MAVHFQEDCDVQSYAEVACLQAPNWLYSDPSSLVKGATAALQEGEQIASRLRKLIDVRGRGSENAAACRALVNDYSIGLDGLRRVLSLVESGDREAVKRIPGIVAAIQESFDFDTILSKMKAYTNKKDKTRALPAYVREVCMGLSGSFNTVFESVRPLSEVLDVRMQIRDRVSAVGNYQFHGTKEAVVAEAPIVEVSTVKEPVPVVTRVPDFIPIEDAWFESESAPQAEVQAASGGFFEKVMGALGGLASSVASAGRGFLPKAALASVVLSLGGCGESTELNPSLASSAEPIPDNAGPITDAPVALAWHISDTRTITHAIRSALLDHCPDSSKAQLIKAEGPMVHKALVAQNDELTQVVKHQATRDANGEWLGKVRTDEARYGNTIATTYPEVLASTASTRIVGAHGLDSAKVEAYARSGLPDYNKYTCPTN